MCNSPPFQGEARGGFTRVIMLRVSFQLSNDKTRTVILNLIQHDELFFSWLL